MAYLLQIETSTSTCSVALSCNGNTIALHEETRHNIHASSLTLFIELVLIQASISIHEVDGIVISKGPGSYTGLRIGTSVAKGLAFALDKPLISINTLQAMTVGMINQYKSSTIFCPMIDARRMEVYTALYDINLQELQPTMALVVNENSFSEELNQGEIVFFGDGSGKCVEILSHQKNAIFAPNITPSAQYASAIGFNKYKMRAFEDVAYFEPYYLKEFISNSKST